MKPSLFYPENLGAAFEKLLSISKTSTCAHLEESIDNWFSLPEVKRFGLGNVKVLPEELSNRLLISVAHRSYKDTSLKVYMLVNKHSADVDTYGNNPGGSCALSTAICNRRDDGALALLDLGADANLDLGLRGQHPLIDTAFKGSPEVLKSLWKHGADMNITNGFGNTVLVAAITGGHVDTVQFLLETVKLNPNTCGGSGLRVMKIDDTNVPLEHDVSWNIRRDQMWSPLHCAVHLKHPDGVQIVKFLLSAGANVHVRCELPHASSYGVYGYTPLEIITIHSLLPGVLCDRHDTKAMAECKQILEQAMAIIGETDIIEYHSSSQ
jgi:ankyrin repeat protein